MCFLSLSFPVTLFHAHLLARKQLLCLFPPFNHSTLSAYLGIAKPKSYLNQHAIISGYFTILGKLHDLEEQPVFISQVSSHTPCDLGKVKHHHGKEIQRKSKLFLVKALFSIQKDFSVQDLLHVRCCFGTSSLLVLSIHSTARI